MHGAITNKVSNMEFLTVVIVLATLWTGAVYTHIDYKEDKKYEEYAEQYKEVVDEREGK